MTQDQATAIAACIASQQSIQQVPRPGHVLVLRTCNADGSSYNGFRWPLEVGAEVSAPDWNPRAICGYGLHGLLWGTGSVGYLNSDSDAKWLVVEVKADEVVDIDQKVKFPRCRVVFVGDRHGAVEFITSHDSERHPCVYGTATAGDRGTATAGDRGTATAGECGTATAGYGGTATAGYGGTATAGECGTATAGYGGTATAGECGSLIIAWWDYSASRYRRAIGEVGENGIVANVPYVVRNGKLVRKDEVA